MVIRPLCVVFEHFFEESYRPELARILSSILGKAIFVFYMLYYYLGATRIPFYHLALIIYPENDWLPGQIEIVPLLVLILILIKAIKYWYDSRKMFEYTRDRKRMRILYRNIVTLREGKLDHNQIEYLHGCVRQDVDFLIRDKNL